MKNKAYYEELLKSYPDVLTLRQFRSMLGEMCEKVALKIVKHNLVKHFVIRRAIYIPKVYAIEYVLSEHYVEYTKRRRTNRRQKSKPMTHN